MFGFLLECGERMNVKREKRRCPETTNRTLDVLKQMLFRQGLIGDTEIDCAGCPLPSKKQGSSNPMPLSEDQLVWS